MFFKILRFEDQEGFTLIETLVAFMVLAISLVMVMQLFSGGLKSNRVAKDYVYGIYHAKEIAEELLLNENLLPGTMSGEFEDGYFWEANVAAPYEVEETEEKPEIDLIPLDILVIVKWMSGVSEKRFEIHTTKLVHQSLIAAATQ